jgi:hypothetical protein
VALDAAGNLYIAERTNNRVRRVDLGGTITTVAGTGAGGYSGDDGPAASARLALPFGVAVDRSLNLFIGDDSNHRVREVARPVLCAQQPAGSPCDDGDPCTDNDTCASSCGRCAGGVVVPDSTNPCVFAACDRLTGTTVQWPMPDGTPCDDGNPCSDPDRCLEGVCVGTILSGDDGNSCTEDLCDVVLGIVHRPLPDGSWCTDGNPCTIDDACLNVVCVGTPTTGSSCDDGNCCTVGDVCSAGACAGTLMSCDDANPCTEDFCLPTICVCAYVLRPDGAACDDGNPCSIGEACIGGVCQGIPKCVDGRTCTDDLCDPQTGGCLYPVNCPPGQGCDAGGACAPGLCWDAVTRCNDLDACTEDTCNPINGKCGHTPICATDVGMASLTVPATVKAGRMANISLQERNYGTRDATGSVTLYRDGSAVKVWTDVVFAAGRSRTQSYGFNTSGYGGRTIQWYAVVTVPGDLNPYNNTSAVRTMVVTP